LLSYHHRPSRQHHIRSNMHSFTQSLFIFYALVALFFLVTPALSAPMGARSNLGFHKRHLSSAPPFRIFPYGKGSDRVLRVNDAYLAPDFRSIVMPDDASSGRAYKPIPQTQPINLDSNHLKQNASLPNPSSSSSRAFLQPIVTWSAKAKPLFTSYFAALEKMHKGAAAHARRQSDI